MKAVTTIGEMYAYASSPAEALKLYEGTGFRYFDYSFYSVVDTPNHPFMGENWKEGIEEVRRVAESLGFTFVQAHAPNCALHGEGADVGLLATLRSIEACGMLGIENMVIHSDMFPELKYPQDKQAYFEANAPFFRALIPAMERNGVHILFENTTIKHCGDGSFFPITGQDLKDFVTFMEHPLFGAAWDTGHANIDSLDHQTELKAMGNVLRAIHVHDNDGKRDQHQAPFLGTMDFDSLMRGLIDIGYKGYFTLEADAFFKYKRRKGEEQPLSHPTTELKRAAISMLYLTCKTILSAYGLWEE